MCPVWIVLGRKYSSCLTQILLSFTNISLLWLNIFWITFYNYNLTSYSLICCLLWPYHPFFFFFLRFLNFLMKGQLNFYKRTHHFCLFFLVITFHFCFFKCGLNLQIAIAEITCAVKTSLFVSACTKRRLHTSAVFTLICAIQTSKHHNSSTWNSL